ncbi:MAG: hypothetical protein M1829_006239 [Trizodia sp. TS-e1964]|nr:MAG: hypothetical protein M1829_006239 [Trizodia sp. TS-e1964]
MATSNSTYDESFLDPPINVAPDFDHPHRRDSTMIAVNLVCLILAVAFVSLRIFTRVMITHAIGWDDCRNPLCLIASIVSALTLTVNYYLGYRLWDVRYEGFPIDQFLVWNVVSYATYQMTMGTIKLSILFLYLRIFSDASRTLRYLTYFGIGVVSCVALSGTLTGIFACRPVESLWFSSVPGVCINLKKQLISQAILNIITNVFTTILPMPTAWSLHLPTKQRIALVAVLASGTIVDVISFFRLFNLVGDWEGAEWGQFDGTMWCIVEPTIAILCASAAPIKPLLCRFFPGLGAPGSRASSRKSIIISDSPSPARDTSSDYEHGKGSDKRTKEKYVSTTSNVEASIFDDYDDRQWSNNVANHHRISNQF